MPSRFKEVLILVTLIIIIIKMAATAPVVADPESEPYIIPWALLFGPAKALKQMHQLIVNLVTIFTGR